MRDSFKRQSKAYWDWNPFQQQFKELEKIGTEHDNHPRKNFGLLYWLRYFLKALSFCPLSPFTILQTCMVLGVRKYQQKKFIKEYILPEEEKKKDKTHIRERIIYYRKHWVEKFDDSLPAKKDAEYETKESTSIDLYVIAMTVISIALFLIPSLRNNLDNFRCWRWLTFIIDYSIVASGFLRLFNIVLSEKEYQLVPIKMKRSVILLFLNYIQAVLFFSTIYFILNYSKTSQNFLNDKLQCIYSFTLLNFDHIELINPISKLIIILQYVSNLIMLSVFLSFFMEGFNKDRNDGYKNKKTRKIKAAHSRKATAR